MGFGTDFELGRRPGTSRVRRRGEKSFSAGPHPKAESCSGLRPERQCALE